MNNLIKHLLISFYCRTTTSSFRYLQRRYNTTSIKISQINKYQIKVEIKKGNYIGQFGVGTSIPKAIKKLIYEISKIKKWEAIYAQESVF